MMKNGIFVTGTDTGVGKTVVCAALTAVLRAEGLDAVPMKPVQTGAAGSGVNRTAPDLEFCLSITGLDVSAREKRLMAPYSLSKPCSPHLAAAAARKRIRQAKILDSFGRLLGDRDMVLVEGAGGVLVPIDGHNTMLDLMLAMKLPVVLVSRPGLGTINHTLLSLRELRRARAAVLGVVINEAGPSARGDIEEDNVRTIERMGRTRILGRLPFMPGLGTAPPRRQAFLEECSKALLPCGEWLRQTTLQ